MLHINMLSRVEPAMVVGEWMTCWKSSDRNDLFISPVLLLKSPSTAILGMLLVLLISSRRCGTCKNDAREAFQCLYTVATIVLIFGKGNADHFIVILSISLYNMESGINFYINSSSSPSVLETIYRF